jgi:hypothetical protein
VKTKRCKSPMRNVTRNPELVAASREERDFLSLRSGVDPTNGETFAFTNAIRQRDGTGGAKALDPPRQKK